MSGDQLQPSAMPLHLLCPTSAPDASQLLSVSSYTYEVVTFHDLANAPVYKCISYIWGPDRIRNPNASGPSQISVNTIPALETLMQTSPGSACWIDAFCVPTTQPAKRQTLESMGAIYSQALEVQVMLSRPTFTVLQRVAQGSVLDDNDLWLLNEDPWVRSVWTYQEVVNSQRLVLVCIGQPECVIEGEKFLDNLGFCLTAYKDAKNIESFGFRQRYPFVDALEDLVADWRVSGYLERSAMSIMAAMNQRTFEREENYFYSMIGALTAEPCNRDNPTALGLAEVFMGLCEAKGDFSFIFSTAERSTKPQKRWRPLSTGLLPAILSWHSYGQSQPGHFDELGDLWLDNVLVLESAPLTDATWRSVGSRIGTSESDTVDSEAILRLASETIVGIGFRCKNPAIQVEDGLLFVDTAMCIDGGWVAVVSTTVRWACGAPAIVQVKDKDSIQYHIGVFVGRVNKEGGVSFCLA